MHRALGTLLLLLVTFTGTLASATEDISSLYQSQAIVTGTGEENRQIGFRQCLRDVLVKVSGDQRILDDPGVTPLVTKAGTYVTSFRYHDRMAGIPIHDEQGTHDRPHDLTCIFLPATLDPLLASLGHKPWIAARPRLVIFLAARNTKKAFVLAADRDDGFYMRDSFKAAAEPLAIPILFPPAALLKSAHIDAADLARTPLPVFDALARQSGGDQALAGSIVWSDKELGWIAEWRLDAKDGGFIWQIRGVSFDDAFRNAMKGAAQILSGNGQPK